MLDLETRRRIDNARDILVGKVPDPKSQVEQITIALIYKFMDDMDKEAVELGGKATFFKGEFAKYSWSNIFDPKLGGVELINLYGEAITKMNQNKYIPQLFRDIFKNASLPYRDPETLKSFLKEINDFHYDHSERLGDAFEYLLSVLGVQGDAGSLRTPRHIIDFIVEVIAPRKNETILDPSCGTAGFLISSYKHILKQNIDNKKGLTPDDRKRLMNSITGYDISPDMVRLSLVNMYLHGFQTPKIYEYDSLTSDDRWNDTFDITLANPPFMTPKGGIRPHKRFQIQAKRSEVLFVDYIMEHIAIDGRAGVIVPEGIIFRSGNAYKALRKELVENNYLYAVVSLPAGVFNPYSGVKTSILLMDRTLAKKTKDILFIKIENDGFDLGAQRREIDKNDLPDALKILKEYKNISSSHSALDAESSLDSRLRGNDMKDIYHLVPKSKISESGDYNLTGDRYRERIIHSHKHWPMVELGAVCSFEYGKALKETDRKGGEYPVYGSNGIVGYHNKYLVGGPFIIVGRKGSAGAVVYSEKSGYPIDTTFYVDIHSPEKIDLKFLYFILLDMELNRVNTQSGVPGLNRNDAYRLKIPLPPLSVQQEIVAEIEGYQKIIDGARQIVENYKPKIKIDESWDVVELGKVCNIQSGGTPSKSVKEYFENGTIPWLRSEVCKDNVVNKASDFITENGFKNSSAKLLKPRTTLIALVGATIGKTAFITIEATTNQNIAGLYPLNEHNILPEYLFFVTRTLYDQFVNLGDGNFKMANLSFVKKLKIPLPPLKIQKQIVAQIEEEQNLIEANKKLIEIFEAKIKAKIAEVWG